MTARAHVAHNFLQRGVEIHLAREAGEFTEVLHFQPAEVRLNTDVTTHTDVAPLFLADDMARALYEALADHYGHSGHDTRALRRDYDAERGRVDSLIRHLIERGQS